MNLRMWLYIRYLFNERDLTQQLYIYLFNLSRIILMYFKGCSRLQRKIFSFLIRIQRLFGAQDIIGLIKGKSVFRSFPHSTPLFIVYRSDVCLWTFLWRWKLLAILKSIIIQVSIVIYFHFRCLDQNFLIFSHNLFFQLSHSSLLVLWYVDFITLWSICSCRTSLHIYICINKFSLTGSQFLDEVFYFFCVTIPSPHLLVLLFLRYVINAGSRQSFLYFVPSFFRQSS